MEREQEQSVVYGSIDFGKTAQTNEKYVELLSKTCKQLHICPHKIKSDDDKVVELYSSLECKGIVGKLTDNSLTAEFRSSLSAKQANKLAN